MKLILVLSVCQVAVARSLDGWNENECGVVASTNPLHQHPWLVHLEYYRRGMQFERRCGGSLVGPRHVLTAAHCVKNAITKNGRLVARLGDYDLSKEMDCVDGVCAHLPIKIQVFSVTLHPQYTGTGHDIAVLTLNQDAPYTETVRPVCLPRGAFSELHTDTIFSASGWGEISSRGVYSDVKKDLRLPYWTPKQCNQAYKHLELPQHIVCAGGQKDIDTCRGDSGGPLVWAKERAELWGVTSTGNVNCGTQGSPGIYTSVIEHLDWLNEVIGQTTMLKKTITKV